MAAGSPPRTSAPPPGRTEGTAEGAAYTPQRSYDPLPATMLYASLLDRLCVHACTYSFREMISYSLRKRVRANHVRQLERNEYTWSCIGWNGGVLRGEEVY